MYCCICLLIHKYLLYFQISNLRIRHFKKKHNLIASENKINYPNLGLLEIKIELF